MGDFKNSGRELRPKGDPEKVRVHDFIIPELGGPIRMGSMISPETQAGSAWAWITIRRRSRSRA